MIAPYTSDYNIDLIKGNMDASIKNNKLLTSYYEDNTVDLEPKVVSNILDECVDCSDKELALLL